MLQHALCLICLAVLSIVPAATNDDDHDVAALLQTRNSIKRSQDLDEAEPTFAMKKEGNVVKVSVEFPSILDDDHPEQDEEGIQADLDLMEAAQKAVDKAHGSGWALMHDDDIDCEGYTCIFRYVRADQQPSLMSVDNEQASTANVNASVGAREKKTSNPRFRARMPTGLPANKQRALTSSEKEASMRLFRQGASSRVMDSWREVDMGKNAVMWTAAYAAKVRGVAGASSICARERKWAKSWGRVYWQGHRLRYRNCNNHYREECCGRRNLADGSFGPGNRCTGVGFVCQSSSCCGHYDDGSVCFETCGNERDERQGDFREFSDGIHQQALEGYPVACSRHCASSTGACFAFAAEVALTTAAMLANFIPGGQTMHAARNAAVRARAAAGSFRGASSTLKRQAYNIVEDVVTGWAQGAVMNVIVDAVANVALTAAVYSLTSDAELAEQFFTAWVFPQAAATVLAGLNGHEEDADVWLEAAGTVALTVDPTGISALVNTFLQREGCDKYEVPAEIPFDFASCGFPTGRICTDTSLVPKAEPMAIPCPDTMNQNTCTDALCCESPTCGNHAFTAVEADNNLKRKSNFASRSCSMVPGIQWYNSTGGARHIAVDKCRWQDCYERKTVCEDFDLQACRNYCDREVDTGDPTLVNAGGQWNVCLPDANSQARAGAPDTIGCQWSRQNTARAQGRVLRENECQPTAAPHHRRRRRHARRTGCQGPYCCQCHRWEAEDARAMWDQWRWRLSNMGR